LYKELKFFFLGVARFFLKEKNKRNGVEIVKAMLD